MHEASGISNGQLPVTEGYTLESAPESSPEWPVYQESQSERTIIK